MSSAAAESIKKARGVRSIGRKGRQMVHFLTKAAWPVAVLAGALLVAGPGAAQDAQKLIETAAKTTDTSFCGTKPITLGIHDGFGINGWSRASMAAVRSEAAKCANVKQVPRIG